MYNTDAAIAKAYRPFDVVVCEGGSIGFIQEVNINSCQPNIEHQVSYAVHWFIGEETKHAWWDHHELRRHCNIFVEISKCVTHPFGSNAQYVEKLLCP